RLSHGPRQRRRVGLGRSTLKAPRHPRDHRQQEEECARAEEPRGSAKRPKATEGSWDEGPWRAHREGSLGETTRGRAAGQASNRTARAVLVRARGTRHGQRGLLGAAWAKPGAASSALGAAQAKLGTVGAKLGAGWAK